MTTTTPSRSSALALSVLLLSACGGGGEPTSTVDDSPPASSGDETATALLECELEGAGAIGIAAPEGSALRANQTGCVVFLGEGSDPATADFVAQWGVVPSDAESAVSFVQSRGMLGDIEPLDGSDATFLGAPAQISHVNAPSPPGIGEAREAWIAWASRGEVNVLAIALCRPDDAGCAASARAMFDGSR